MHLTWFNVLIALIWIGGIVTRFPRGRIYGVLAIAGGWLAAMLAINLAPGLGGDLDAGSFMTLLIAPLYALFVLWLKSTEPERHNWN